MEDLLADKRGLIAAACNQFGVTQLKLFGSATTGAFDSSSSDFDFLVKFEPNRQRPSKDFLGLLDALRQITGREIDLVDESSIRNPYFRQSALSTARLVYGH